MHELAPTTSDPAEGLVALLEQLTDLPTHPGAALGILSVIDDPRSSATDLARLVDADPALSARVLRLANSVVYGLSRQVASAQVAVTVIGFDTVRSLAVLAASGAFAADGSEAPDGFWGHSIAVASGSAVIARRRGVPANEAFSAGLLHDLGGALLFKVDPQLAIELDDEVREDPSARLDRELSVYGMHHGEAGACVLDAWGFPATMVEVLREHHRTPVVETSELVRVIRAGEALAALGGAPVLLEGTPDTEEALGAVGLDIGDCDDLSRQVASEAESLVNLLLG